MQTMLISGNTHPGKRRKENQDAYIFRPLWSADKMLLAVVDGVGGYAGGEKAASIARDCIEQYMQMPRGDTMTMLREAVIFANNRIFDERKNDQHTSEMCCVLTAVVADETARTIYFVHVGDTRLYRYRNSGLQKLTKDHSFVGMKEDAGEITEMEAMNHPHRNQILREVGSAPHRLDDPDFMDYGTEDFLPGDTLLLCSDGLTDMITVQQIATLLSTGQPLDNKITNLITLANEMGGNDNITVVLLQYPLTISATPNKTDTPVFAENPEAVPRESAPKKKSPPEKSRRLWVVLLLILVASAGWYFLPPKTRLGSAPVVVSHPVDTTTLDINRILPARRITHPAVPGPDAAMMTDTLRIKNTKNFADLQHYIDSTGRLLVLMPAKNSHTRFAAVEITKRSAKPGDTLLISNLRLSNFETGIKVQIPVILKTENLVFENTRYPFSYVFKPDSNQRTALFMNTMKQ